MSSVSSIISLNQVSLGYGKGQSEQRLVHNLNLAVTNRQLIALVGSNGAGKSTLLRTIAGLQKPHSGTIELLNKSINTLNAKAFARYISIVLTGQAEISYVKAAELIAMGRLPHTGWLGNFSTIDQQKVNAAVEQAKVIHLLDKPIYQLSDGERQKVMIARALAQDTPIMILDEPTTHLDITNQVNIIQLLRTLVRNQQKCIIFSTHNIELALQVADRLWLMHQQTVIDKVPEDLVLSGTLPEAMSTDQAPFNPESGTFQVQHEENHPIALTGSGIRARWTQRALERAGYYLQPRSAVSVEIIANNHWNICNNNKLVSTVQSIESLLLRLSQLYSP
ncbi:ABC transporter ATP-binding protein [Tunicatimonas pelagia]|uniref:ABC transporter ATP-binding protein n=1 Tax=Tunicatimonas pelagia TaxID=931531 RepID=UPI0026668F0E|nr:ABC transporter ATP-binding protein [Tunicatimonas pelagia]WKN42645.1 ABC transporter ATP-binding protein [Tunicatimonas pelagia]